MSRRLTDEQRQHKQVIIALATTIFQNNSALLNDYDDGDEWRLARVDDDISKGSTVAFQRGDITVARKETRPLESVPKIFAFSWRARAHMILKTTDPIEFLED